MNQLWVVICLPYSGVFGQDFNPRFYSATAETPQQAIEYARSLGAHGVMTALPAVAT